MFSSDETAENAETLEEGQSSISLPEEEITQIPNSKPKKTRGKKASRNSLAEFRGMPHVLDFPERVEAWHDHVLGADVFDLSLKFQTSIVEIEDGINAVIAELGFPHTHIDPELERFKIIEASDRMKVAQLGLLKESQKTREHIKKQRTDLKQQREEIHIGKNTTPDELKLLQVLMKAEAELEFRHQMEVKSTVALMAEYRATNLVIADLTGIKRTKPVRKPKVVKTVEQELEESDLSIEELTELAEGKKAA
jgi:hypothetical protein